MVLHPLADLLALASREGRVCPKPSAWSRLYELLPNRKNDGYGFIPATPPGHDAWAQVGDEDKRHRLIEHLRWAEAHGALSAVRQFLARLPESEWHHVGD